LKGVAIKTQKRNWKVRSERKLEVKLEVKGVGKLEVKGIGKLEVGSERNWIFLLFSKK